MWIDGTKNEDKGESTTVETLDSAPADYNCKADTVNVTVHYYRDDGLYYNAKDTKRDRAAVGYLDLVEQLERRQRHLRFP